MMGAPRKLNAPGRPEKSDFKTEEDFKRAYNEWYRKNYVNKDKKALYRKRDVERQKERRREKRAGVYASMKERYVAGIVASSEVRCNESWYKNRIEREKEIASRVQVINLPEGMSAEEYEKVIFS